MIDEKRPIELKVICLAVVLYVILQVPQIVEMFKIDEASMFVIIFYPLITFLLFVSIVGVWFLVPWSWFAIISVSFIELLWNAYLVLAYFDINNSLILLILLVFFVLVVRFFAGPYIREWLFQIKYQGI